MKIRHAYAVVLLAVGGLSPEAAVAQSGCCLGDFFAGCGTCFRKPPAYAVAPVVAPIPAPPPPVMVPVQQTSYVPETTYRTEYKTVPVTTYKPSCEIDPCTGCPIECMQPVTQYVQQAVNVPVTQYRAVTSTKYVQMQQAAPAAYGAPVAYPAPVGMVPGPAVPAPGASPFAAPITTTPQAWGAAGSDVSNQLAPGQQSINPPSLPAATAAPTYQQRPIAPPAYGPVYVQPGAAGLPAATYQAAPVQTYAQPQAAGAAAVDATTTQRPTQPPAYTPPPLKPIPIMPKAAEPTAAATGTPAQPAVPAPALPASPAPAPAASGTGGLPVVPGSGPTGATGAFPRLLEPTSHTTQWQPANPGGRPATFRPAYPTAALPLRSQQ